MYSVQRNIFLDFTATTPRPEAMHPKILHSRRTLQISVEALEQIELAFEFREHVPVRFLLVSLRRFREVIIHATSVSANLGNSTEAGT